MSASPEILAVDVGTGSVRAGLVGLNGQVRALNAIAHGTLHPHHGWAEQRPEDWWTGACKVIAATLAQARGADVVALACCGQMHAPVLVDRHHHLVRDTVPLWNDKRAASLAPDLMAELSALALPRPVNPPTSAWPGVKLAWMARHDRSALNAAHWLLMPKDWLNLRLTGEAAMDWTEAGSSFLTDPTKGEWSPATAQAMGLNPSLLPPILPTAQILSRVTSEAARQTGLKPGLPVVVGAGDFPVAILGSGVTRPGQVSDITGTSFLLTSLGAEPVLGPQVMNVATATPGWGAFAVVDAAGDAIRWASRAIDRGARDFEALSAEAETVPAGADGLVFLPYLTGERLGQGAGSRAAFLGLTANHGSAHLHRAIMEGIVLAMREAYAPIAQERGTPQVIFSAAGGAKSRLMLEIKANVFGCPVITPEEPEAGLVGVACLAFSALGHFANPTDAATALVHHRPPTMPDPALQRRYGDLAAAFAAVRKAMPLLNSSLGRHA